MHTVKQFIKYYPKQSLKLLWWGIVGALFKTLLFILLNEFITTLAALEKNAWFLIGGVVALAGSVLLETIYYRKSAFLIQQVLQQLKVRLLNDIKNTPLLAFEKIGATNFFATISQHTGLISHIATFLPVSLLQGSLSLFFMLLYISTQAPVASLLFLVWLVIIGTFIYAKIGPALVKVRKASRSSKKGYFQQLSHILKGFKEMRVHKERRDAVLQAYTIHTQQAAKLMRKNIFIDRLRLVYADPSFLGLLAVLVFVLGPLASVAYQQVVMSIVILLLMLMRGVYYTLITFEDWNAVDASIQALTDMCEELKQQHPKVLPPAVFDKTLLRQHIELRDVHFTYPSHPQKTAYGIGPINLKVEKGECLFIIGGNGSGKSTLLKVLTQLYAPQQGQIYQDRKAVGLQAMSRYQQLFSTIFTDFHLFDQLYGLENVNQEHVLYLLRLFDIDRQVMFNNKKFYFSGLSTGQRKRLAMLHAFLENRAIYIFDEVAADQDPSYRKFFYEVVLHDLKQLKKTVIAVSHDDHYFHIADRVLEMVDGQLKPYSK